MLCAVTLGLLCVSALVSGAETSFFSLSHNDIRRLRKRTTASAEAVLRLLTNVDLLLATILVVNNLVNICIVILTSSIIDSVFTFLRFEFLFKTVLVTFLLLLFLFRCIEPLGWRRVFTAAGVTLAFTYILFSVLLGARLPTGRLWTYFLN